jgi:hypothetical protein
MAMRRANEVNGHASESCAPYNYCDFEGCRAVLKSRDISRDMGLIER